MQEQDGTARSGGDQRARPYGLATQLAGLLDQSRLMRVGKSLGEFVPVSGPEAQVHVFFSDQSLAPMS